MRPDDRPPDPEPQVAAALGFIFAAISGILASLALVEARGAAEYIRSVGRQAVSGGPAFALNLGILAWELPAYAVGFPALMALFAVLWWKPSISSSWVWIAGLVCLAPMVLLFLGRCGFQILPL